jgi:hypothetical protein
MVTTTILCYTFAPFVSLPATAAAPGIEPLTFRWRGERSTTALTLLALLLFFISAAPSGHHRRQDQVHPVDVPPPGVNVIKLFFLCH